MLSVRKAALSLFLAAAMVVASRADSWAGVFNPVTWTLPNGMQVVVLPNHRAPVVFQMVMYKVGSADEQPGKTGLAHLLEHLMFKGTKKHPNGEFSKLLAQSGADENAFTSYDYTGYFQTVPKDRLGLVMNLEADRMTNLTLSPDQVKTEVNVVLEERNMRVDDSPSALLREKAEQKLFPKGHPYGRPVIGWRKEVKALSGKDALAFYKTHYAPNNAILLIAGDVTVDQVRRLADKYYAPIPRAKVPPRPDLIFSGPVQGGETVLKDARVRQATWSESVIQPSLTNGSYRDVAAREVLSELLGGDATSRLYRALVIDQGIAVSAGSFYDGEARGPGRFVFYAQPRPGVSLDKVSAAVETEAKRLLLGGLKDGELARIKKRMLTDAIFSRDSMSAGARTIGTMLAAGHDLAAVEQWPEHIKAVSEEDVMDALKSVLDESRRITTRLLPADKDAKATGDAS